MSLPACLMTSHHFEQWCRRLSFLSSCSPEGEEQPYLIFDCPGQVELVTLHNGLQLILKLLDKKLHYRYIACMPADNIALKCILHGTLKCSNVAHFLQDGSSSPR